MSDKIKKQIMSEIKDDKLKMTSRWVFVAKSIGLKSGLALCVTLFVFSVNAFLFYIKSNNLLMSWHYGESSWQQTLHSLPYDLILIIIVLILFLNFIIKRFEFSYLHPFVIIFTFIIIASVFISVLIFITNFNYAFGSRLEQSKINIPYISDFYINRCHCSLRQDAIKFYKIW